MKNLYIEQKIFKITDHYPVVDESGNTLYLVDQDFRLIGFSVDISDANQTVLCHIERKIISLLPTFYLSFNDGLEISMKSRFSLLRRKIDIDPENLEIYIEGDIFDHHYSVYKNDKLIGRINKKYFSFRDNYELQIIDERYELLFVAIVVGVDHLIDASQTNSSHSSN